MPSRAVSFGRTVLQSGHLRSVVIVSAEVQLWSYILMNLEPERVSGQPGLPTQWCACSKAQCVAKVLQKLCSRWEQELQRPAIPGGPFQCALIVPFIV
jgi:hypothetical protein